jgi:beta-mannosidase
MQDRRGLVKWQLRKSDGSIIREGKEEVSVPALSSVWLDKEDMKDADIHRDYVSYQLIEDGEPVSQGTVLFCPPKHFKFADPKLSVSLEGDEIIVSASAYAKSVEIRNENDDLILSDNFFDLNGDSKTVKVLQGKADGITVRSVYDIR